MTVPARIGGQRARRNGEVPAGEGMKPSLVSFQPNKTCRQAQTGWNQRLKTALNQHKSAVNQASNDLEESHSST